MLTKATKAKASKPVKPPAAGASETDGVERERSQRPPVVFTPTQKRRMRALFDLRNERLLTAAEQEELTRLVNAEWDAAIERATRKVLAAHPEYADEHGNLNTPLVDKLLRERYADETRSNEESKPVLRTLAT